MAHSLEQFIADTRRERLESVLKQRTNNLTVLLDRVTNFHNISAVLRSADAFGLRDVHLIGRGFEYSKTISKGSENWMQILRHQNAESAIANLRGKGFKLAVLRARKLNEPIDNNCPVYALPFEEKLALVFGNEKRGPSKEILDAADLTAHIPMFGFVESFNISVAAAITLFCSTFSGAFAERRPARLSDREQAELWDLWLRKSVFEGEKILEEVSRREEKTKP